MDEQKQCNISGINEQYKLMNRERIRISEELAQEKIHGRQINYKIWYFSYIDNRIKDKMRKINSLEYNLGKVKPSLPTKYVPRTSGVLCLSGRYAQRTVRPDRKRCQQRVIKKGRMDIKYFEVQEEHLSLVKPGNYWPYCGTQELDNMMESLVQRIKHGNWKRVEEMRIFQEINNFKKTKESYIAPDAHSYERERRSKRDIDQKRAMQHKINIRLEDIEYLKGELIEREARVRRLKAELEYVRKNIGYLNKKLDDVNIKLPEAYKRPDELVDRKKINIRLEDIEYLKGELIGREARVRLLKVELEHVRKNFRYLNKKLDDVNIKLPEAYKRYDELVDRKKELVSYSVPFHIGRHKFMVPIE